MFSGTVRFNLDPFNLHADHVLVEALQSCDLQVSKRCRPQKWFYFVRDRTESPCHLAVRASVSIERFFFSFFEAARVCRSPITAQRRTLIITTCARMFVAGSGRRACSSWRRR
jgi:hypothetical protein